MKIFICQHGQALDKEKDPERGLSKDGIKESEKVSKVLKDYNITIKKVICSSKKRATETAEIFKINLDIPKLEIMQEGLNPEDNVLDFIETGKIMDGLLIIGHLPFLNKLLGHLVVNNSSKEILHFQNSGVVCLEKNESKTFLIKWIIMPNVE